ncbi:hypothetical protein D9758_002023 [Tetrapyrgos nigripes]|uniref:Vacuolar protein sorting-associated protein 8 central domain-containing protein n=1 Tax=Tetrapyrgos nigripes TaxID=182062 RepID=A0A8H5LV83_9AGAR|nr:hypothetical protein D9758_002023 [Tetrapyrgos nigripes]
MSLSTSPQQGDRFNLSPPSSLGFSDNEDDDEHEHEHTGDYSTRMEELFEDEEDQNLDIHHDDDSEDDEGFIYTGADADVSIVSYKDQLRDVLGPEHESEADSTEDAREVERSLIVEGEHVSDDDEALPTADSSSNAAPSLMIMTPPRNESPTIFDSPSKLARPFLHPNVSRLRSYTPQGSRVSSTSSIGTSASNPFHVASPSPSHFSSLSRLSSSSNTRAPSTTDNSDVMNTDRKAPERESFKWTQLRNIASHVYSAKFNKTSSLLGSSIGFPTTLAANGLICIGTDDGQICVYDFKQNLKCICKNGTAGKSVGAVTALALSHDHTYVASGHSSGHIQLFDLSSPQVPARFVPPTALAVVSSGRKEGHIQGSRIVNIGFVAGRHTAIVSADEHGLAFYHSLGKVLFVEAPDILRILGKYPLDGPPASPDGTPVTPTPPRKKSRYSILAMMPLPLGTASHPTDTYHIVALLTPSKLVIVGLKPTPKTWFKCPRNSDPDESKSKSKWRGSLSWFPNVTVGDDKGGVDQLKKASPTLAYSWGCSMHIIRVFESRSTQTVRNSRTGRTSELEVGTVAYEDVCKWSAEDDILALQWLNANQLVILTSSTLQVFDVRRSKIAESIPFNGLSLISPSLRSTTTGHTPYSVSVGDVAHSIRVYKQKIFLLEREQVQVGTLLTWADKILSCVEDGDFLSAIELARNYYLGTASGNQNGLPEDSDGRQLVVGQKIRELMVASTRYAFSEDRMADGTHYTPDGRGVDRTALFEGLVATCCRACIAIDDYDFLFEDLFQHYDDSGISRIYLTQLERFVLDSEIRYVPPRITQKLVAMHDADGRADLVERIIWHIDAECLDINQAIVLCQSHQLYDALIYVYTRALRDYVAPVVELLDLIRDVHRHRKRNLESIKVSRDEEARIESSILNAYKIYPYLANALAGLIYPSEKPLPEAEALTAKKDVYTFLFFGRSNIWPPGEGGRLVLTADEEGGVEPPYPYIQQLLRFDSESFLHSLDIAFEDPYLNDDSQGISRLVIIRILMEVSNSDNLTPTDVTFINIFIARNIPKYPQFLHMSPTDLHNILIGLAQDPDPNTREDRQLAVEYLLSAYNPHDSAHILALFEQAGFYRILRSWHRQDRKWVPLLSTYLDDPDLSVHDVFRSIEEVLEISLRGNKGSLPSEVAAFMPKAVSRLLRSGVRNSAMLIDKYTPSLHEQAIDLLGDNATEDQYIYLRHILGPPDEDGYDYPPNPSQHVSDRLRQLYVSLQCKFHPEDVIRALKYLPPDIQNWDEVVLTCESNDIFDAVIWALDFRGQPLEALAKVDAFEKRLTLKMTDLFLGHGEVAAAHPLVRSLESIGRIGITVCVERSQGASASDVPLEDIWFKLLDSQIRSIQMVSNCCLGDSSDATSPTPLVEAQRSSLSSLRSLVQETFGALVSISSTCAVSFPRLFTRLVNSATQTTSTTGAQYTEFRSILTGMLESYRSDGDMLIIAKHLVDRDLFDALAEVTRERAKGWSSKRLDCSVCRKPLFVPTGPTTDTVSPADQPDRKLIVSRTGSIQHSNCLSA